MSDRAFSIVCLSALTAVAGYEVLDYGGGGPDGWSIAMVGLGAAGMVLGVPASRMMGGFGRGNRVALWAALLFPAYAAFQLVHLPAPLLHVLSPARAEMGDAVAAAMPVHAALFTGGSLSVGPPRTWTQGSRIVGYALVFLLVQELARRSARRLWVVAAPLIAIGAIEAALGLAQYFNGAEAVTGTYQNKDHLAGLLEMILPLAIMAGVALLYRGWEPGEFRPSLVVAGFAVLGVAAGTLVTVTVSLSRMGYIATFASLFVMGALALGSRRQGWTKWPALLGLAALILAAFALLPSDELIAHFGDFALDQGPEGRWPIWKDTLHLVAAYPWFGCGLGNYYPAILRYQTSGLSIAWTAAHNDYLQLLSELGVAGFAIPAVLMGTVFLRAMRAGASGVSRDVRFLGLALVGGIAAILIHSLADFNLYDTANALILAWMCGLAIGLPQSVRVKAGERSFRGPVLALAGGLALYGIASLAFVHKYDGDPGAERAFCRFGICDSEAALNAETLMYGGKLAAVPPAKLLAFVQRDPAAPDRWEDLGDSLQNVGLTEEARQSFARALMLGPRVAYMLVRAANFHFALGEQIEGLALMGRAVDADPAYTGQAFAEYEQRQIAPDEIFRHGLPDAQAAQSYLDRLIGNENGANAANTWTWMLSKGWADPKIAIEYVNWLVQTKNYDAAAHAWANYQGARAAGYLKSNYIFNGDFESDSARSPFDWRIDGRPGFKIDIDQQVEHSGHRSARIRFDGTQNVEWIDLSEAAFVPAGRYKFQAYVKLDGITTDQGVSFQIESGQSNVSTDNVVGTSDWRLVEKEFQVPANAGLTQVRAFRRRSWRADDLIKGTMWIDQVKIIPENALAD